MSDSNIAVNGLLRTIQRPLTSMGRIFADEIPSSLHLAARSNLEIPAPPTGLSSATFQPPRNMHDMHDEYETPDALRDGLDENGAQATTSNADPNLMKRASSEMAEIQRLQKDDHDGVVQ